MQNEDYSNRFVGLTFIFGILAITTTLMMTVYLPFIFGGLALVFGILSRTHNNPIAFKVKLGMIFAVIGLICNLFIIVTSVHTVFTNPEMKQELNQMCESMYGQSFDEMIEEIVESY